MALVNCLPVVKRYTMEKIIVHPIPVWQDPNTYLNIEFIRDELFCYFKCLNEELMKNGIRKEEKHLGVLHVKRLLAIKHNRFTRLTLYPIPYEHEYASYYYEIENSLWLEESLAQRKVEDQDWEKYDRITYKHFVFENSKYWVEVIAKSVDFAISKRSKYKLDLWSKI